MTIFICSSIYSVYSLVTATYCVMEESIYYSRWQHKVKCEESSIYSVYSLVTATILCNGGINCRWQHKVKCDYFYLFLYLFSLFFSDSHEELSVATQGKM